MSNNKSSERGKEIARNLEKEELITCGTCNGRGYVPSDNDEGIETCPRCGSETVVKSTYIWNLYPNS